MSRDLFTNLCIKSLCVDLDLCNLNQILAKQTMGSFVTDDSGVNSPI